MFMIKMIVNKFINLLLFVKKNSRGKFLNGLIENQDKYSSRIDEMPVNKTQEFVYFLNKAKHYETIKTIKPSVKDRLEQKYLKTLSFSSNDKEQKPAQKKRTRMIPLIKSIAIKQQNQKMIVRLLRMYKSQRTEVNAQGNYSRFNKQQRPFRHSNPYTLQRNRTIQIQNNGMKQRINKIKPCVGNSSEWNRHFDKSVELKKNMSRYLMEESRSRRSLHGSRIVSRYGDGVVGVGMDGEGEKRINNDELEKGQGGCDVVLNLPDIKVKAPQFTHSMKHHQYKRMILIDSSRSSLNSVTDKTHQIHNPQKNAAKCKKEQQNQPKLPNFKFFEHESNGKNQKNINIKSAEAKEQKQNEPKIVVEAKPSTGENKKDLQPKIV